MVARKYVSPVLRKLMDYEDLIDRECEESLMVIEILPVIEVFICQQIIDLLVWPKRAAVFWNTA